MAELKELGAPRVGAPEDMVQWQNGQWFRRTAATTHYSTGPRPQLEWLVRQRVLADPRIELIEGHETVGLTGDSSRVRGVRLRERGAGAEKETRVLEADLVVDASGRSTKAADWLAAIGAEAPHEETLDTGLAYGTRVYRSCGHGRGHRRPRLLHRAQPLPGVRRRDPSPRRRTPPGDPVGAARRRTSHGGGGVRGVREATAAPGGQRVAGAGRAGVPGVRLPEDRQHPAPVRPSGAPTGRLPRHRRRPLHLQPDLWTGHGGRRALRRRPAPGPRRPEAHRDHAAGAARAPRRLAAGLGHLGGRRQEDAGRHRGRGAPGADGQGARLVPAPGAGAGRGRPGRRGALPCGPHPGLPADGAVRPGRGEGRALRAGAGDSRPLRRCAATRRKAGVGGPGCRTVQTPGAAVTMPAAMAAPSAA